MASVKAFNQTLQEFLNELQLSFPEEESIEKQKKVLGLDTLDESPKALDTVMPELAKHADMISKKDDQFIQFFQTIFVEIHFEKLWGNMSAASKKVVWDYLNTLLMLGTTIKTIPTNMLSEIEKIAQSCVSQMQENQSQPDEVFLNAQQSIMNNGMLQNMLGQLGNIQGLAPPVQQPQQQRITHKPKSRKGKKK